MRLTQSRSLMKSPSLFLNNDLVGVRQARHTGLQFTFAAPMQPLAYGPLSVTPNMISVSLWDTNGRLKNN